MSGFGFLIIPILVFQWLLSIVAAAQIGAYKNATGTGFLFGLVFGPLGVIMAACLDERPNCPRCGGKSNKSYRICQHCGVKLYWTRTTDKPLLAKEYKKQRAKYYANQVSDMQEVKKQREIDDGNFDKLVNNEPLPPKFDEWGKPL